MKRLAMFPGGRGWKLSGLPPLVLALVLSAAARGAPPRKQPAAGTSPAGSDAPTLRVREIYVPYEEFEALTRGKPDGMIMKIDEYRELIRRCARNLAERPSEELPPAEAAILEAAYTGSFEAKAVRFHAVLKLRVTSEDWVRCDLGAPLGGLGNILVDDAPGWVVIDPGTAKPGAKKSKRAAPSPRAYLLVRGKGEHRVDLAFSAPVAQHEDRYTLESLLVPAPAARLELEVPGSVEASSEPKCLETRRGPKTTTLVLSAGSAREFRLEWKRRKAVSEQAVFLAAEHTISFAVRRDNPVFLWKASVTVARRKTDSLLFTEPPGTSVLRLSGPLVHAWERTDKGLAVTLNKAVLGKVALEFQGVIDTPGERYTLGAPQLQEAFSNTGHLVLYRPADAALAVESVKLAGESAPSDARVPPSINPAGEAGRPVRLARLYSFTETGAEVTVALSPLPLRFEVHGTTLATVAESGADLQGLVRLTVREGRMYQSSILVPSPWRLASLAEVGAKGRSLHGIRRETHETDGGTRVDLTLDKAASMGDPVELTFRLEHGAFGEDRAWKKKTLDVFLPDIAGASRARWDLGIALPSSMDALMENLPGWRSLSPEEVEHLGIVKAAHGQARELIAGLTTRRTPAKLSFTLIHRPARGEYREVTHLLALERVFRVRVDVRLTAVDRPLGSVVFRLPPAAGPSTVLLGPGIKEIETTEGSSHRTVRFSRPWLGTRQFRVEFEAALQPETDLGVPAVEVAPEGGQGYFGGERFLVLQSQGPVEIQPPAGPGLSAVGMDELPDFARPWAGGRVLTAYRFHAAGDPGKFRTIIHERAPVLARLARKMNLTTVLGPEGVSRTRAEILLAYSREQDFTVELPPDARCLAVTVDGAPVRAVIIPAAGPGRPEAGVFAIPLPPQSYATVAITYERPAPPSAAAGNRSLASSLGSWGAWSEDAPRLRGIPVGETTWLVHHPRGYTFHLRGGNVRTDDARVEGRFDCFADSFFGRIFTGRLPVFTVFLREKPAGRPVAIPALTPEEKRGAQRQSSGAATAGRLKPRAAGQTRWTPQTRSMAPRYHLIPEGLKITVSKLGGNARVDLSYASLVWWRFSKRTLFWGSILVGWLLFLRRRKRAFWNYILWGLFLGTLVPLVLDWKSPLLLVPFCEGLAVSAVVFGSVSLLRHLAALVKGRKQRALAAAAPVILLPLVLAAPLAMAAPAAAKQAKGAALPPLPTDGVLIPYDTATLPGAFGTQEKVYVPYRKFVELWNIAFGQEGEKETKPPPGPSIVLGNAAYTLSIEGDACRISGTLEVNVLTKRWVTLPLPLERSRLRRILVDGKDTGVGQGSKLPGAAGPPGAAIPFVEIHGEGRHRIELELMAPVRRQPGEFKILTALPAGAAATLRATLPPGAKVEARTGNAKASPVITTASKTATGVRVDLGGSSRLELSWSFPKIEGQTGSQVDSLAYERLDLSETGYRVERMEKVQVTGRPVDAVEYTVEGNWRITEVTGVDLSEWSMLQDKGDPSTRRLQIFLARPVNACGLLIKGQAIMDASAPLATLSLAGAVKQETFVGLRHSTLRRFGESARFLQGGMKRVDPAVLRRSFRVPDANMPSRVYHVYGSGKGNVLSAEPVPAEVTVDTKAILLLELDRLVVSVRSRYKVMGPGPVRHEVALPPDWSVRTVRCKALRDWSVAGSGASRRLVLDFADRAPTGTEIHWSAERTYTAPPGRLVLPTLRVKAAGATKLEESLLWALAASDELELSVAEETGMLHVPRGTIEKWMQLPPLASYRFGLRTPRAARRAPATPAVIGVRRRPSQLSAVVVSFVRVTEEFLHVNARLIFQVRMAGRDRFRMILPEGAELVSMETRNERSRDVTKDAGGTRIRIVLQSPAAGEHAVDLAYRIARVSGQNPTVLPIRVLDGDERLTDVDQYVGVLQTAATFLSSSATQGLVRVEAETLPYLPEGVSARNLQPTYQARKLDWSLALAEEVIEIAEGPAAIVELAEISSTVGGDGTVRTRVVYTLRNRNLQFLVVELPPGADLWGVTLNGRSVAVGRAGAPSGNGSAPEVLQIPVEHVGSASLNLEISLQYEEAPLDLPAMRGSGTLRAPRVQGTDVVETIWKVEFPDGYWLSMSGGNVREVVSSAQFASKVRNLLDQYKKISKAVKESDSRKVREQAARDIARLEQVLGDNVSELVENNRSSGEQAQSARLGQQSVDEQWMRNDALIQESLQVQKSLQEARKQREKQQAAGASRGKKEQAFFDAGNFLRQSWRGGKQSKRSGQRPPAVAAGAAGLDAILEDKPFGGINDLKMQKLPQGAEIAGAAEPSPRGGLKPLPETLIVSPAPGLEAPTAAKGCRTYTFLKNGGNAEVTLSFTRRDTGPRFAGALLLLAAAVLLVWRVRRGRRP